MELAQELIEDRLDHWPVASLATAAASGRPHQVPIVFARLGECLWSPIDGKPKTGSELSRVRNVRERPQVSLLLDEYADDWEQLWWIRIEANGRVVQPEDPQQDATFLAAQDALRLKYPQYDEVPLLQGRPTMLVFDWLRILSWCGAASA